MFFNKLIYIITPSKITTPDGQLDNERLAYAVTSMASLKYNIGKTFPHIVIDDSGTEVYARAIYKDCTFIEGDKNGMLIALMKGAQEAKNRGAEAVFIHLDDMYYSSQSRELFRHAADAMLKRDTLNIIHLSNFPIIDNRCLVHGNQTFLDIDESGVSFDHVKLLPFRHTSYTIWLSDFKEDMIKGEFWPLALWFAFYRTDFLIKILSSVMEKSDATTLGDAELFLRKQHEWYNIVHAYPVGEIGYINMQFGGFEMHRNKNFLNVIKSANKRII